MSDTQQPDHDQRLKVLIKEFFEQFFLCFFPDWAKWLDFKEVIWIDKLKAEEYVSGEHLLGVALSGLMKASPERRAELYAESLNRIAKSRENDRRQYLLAECLEAYINLDDEQRQQFQRLMDAELYQEARPLMITTYERGKAEGKLEGKAEGKQEGKAEGKLEDRREMALLLLEEKFAPLSPEVQQRVLEMNAEQLRQVIAKILKASSLEELLHG